MKLHILLSLAMLSLAWGYPARMEEGQQLLSQSPDTLLRELSDLGSQHAEGGERKARFLWGGVWAGPYWPRYYYGYHYRPWGYSYWW